MSRYKIVKNVSDNTDTFFNVNMLTEEDFSFESRYDNKNNTYIVNESLNKYDFYDTLLEKFIDEYKSEISNERLNFFAKVLKKDKKESKKYLKEKYLFIIKNNIDEKYITFNMATKLVKNGLGKALPSKFDKLDFAIDYNDEEEVLSLKNKYRKVILKDELNYNKEEKRSLKHEKERINKLIDEKLQKMAQLSQCRNNIDEKTRKLNRGN